MDFDSVNCSSHIRTKEKRSFTFRTKHLNYYSTPHHYRRLLEWYFAIETPAYIQNSHLRFIWGAEDLSIKLAKILGSPKLDVKAKTLKQETLNRVSLYLAHFQRTCLFYLC
jgi:hypothetical protein